MQKPLSQIKDNLLIAQFSIAIIGQRMVTNPSNTVQINDSLRLPGEVVIFPKFCLEICLLCHYFFGKKNTHTITIFLNVLWIRMLPFHVWIISIRQSILFSQNFVAESLSGFFYRKSWLFNATTNAFFSYALIYYMYIFTFSHTQMCCVKIGWQLNV